ncbi:MAG: LysR family transcriptional regulator substrate-binding protein [Planctomycetaceae bacterium]|nr:LysR family transcriptional regulator substrate-binding protein [Planctomycetaceae bacterium]
MRESNSRNSTRLFRIEEALGTSGWIDESNGDFVPAIQVDNVTAAIQIVRESNAIAATPVRLVEQELTSGKLVELPFHKPWLRLNYGFIYLRDSPLSRTAEGFMNEDEAVERSSTT